MPAAASAQSRQIGEREFVVLMASLMALVALSIDSMLPALGEIARDLDAGDPNRRQLVIGVYLFAAALGALLPGALADRFGRRPVLFGALALYTLFALASALVTDFNTLLLVRGLQAFLSAGLSVLPNAIIRDSYEGDRMARMMSTTALVFMAVPMLAPSYGQAILLFAGWRWIFGCTAVLAVGVGVWAWLRLPETLDPANKQAIRLGAIFSNMRIALSDRSSIGYVIGGGVLWAGMFGFLNSSQQLVAEHFGAAERFPLLFAVSLLKVDVVRLVLGERWMAAAPILGWLALLHCFYAIGPAIGPYLLARQRADVAFWMNVWAALLYAAAVAVGARHGAEGVAIALLIATATGLFTIGFWVRWNITHMGGMAFIATLMPGLVAATAAYGAADIFLWAIEGSIPSGSWRHLLSGLALGGAVYAGVLVLWFRPAVAEILDAADLRPRSIAGQG